MLQQVDEDSGGEGTALTLSYNIWHMSVTSTFTHLVVKAQLRLRSRRTSFAHRLFHLGFNFLVSLLKHFHLQGRFFQFAGVELVNLSQRVHSPPRYFCIFFVDFAVREWKITKVRGSKIKRSHIMHPPGLSWQTRRLNFSFLELKIFRELKCSS